MTQAENPPADDLAAQAAPLSGPDPLQVPVEEIPLPPEHLVDELDNTPAVEALAPAREVATLSFVGDGPAKEFPLRFPFLWNGETVSSVTVRCLSTAEMGEAMRAIGAEADFDLFDIYARMTGLAAPVLRALPSLDGEPITAACFDFLPPSFRPASV